MSMDLWEQLAEKEVPAPPPTFERQLHGRLNKALVVLHLADLLFKGMVFAVAHFAQAVFHLLAVTLTGRLQSGVPRRKDKNS